VEWPPHAGGYVYAEKYANAAAFAAHNERGLPKQMGVSFSFCLRLPPPSTPHLIALSACSQSTVHHSFLVQVSAHKKPTLSFVCSLNQVCSSEKVSETHLKNGHSTTHSLWPFAADTTNFLPILTEKLV
jgi:hypothetical protein